MVKSNLCEGIIPQVSFESGTATTNSNQGLGDKVAIIAPFPKISPSLEYYSNIRDAKRGLKWTTGINDVYKKSTSDEKLASKDYFTGAACLHYLFKEGLYEPTISQVIVCNYTTAVTVTDDSGNTTQKCENDEPIFYTGIESADKSKDYLDVALDQLKGEDFDILLLGFVPSMAQLKKIIEWENDEYTNANPIGLIFGCSEDALPVINQNASVSSDTSSVVQSIIAGTESKSMDKDMIGAVAQDKNSEGKGILGKLELFSNESKKDGNNHTLYACIPQSVHLSYEATDKYLTPIETAAFYAGELGVTSVDKSLTSRVIPYIDGVNEDLVYTVSADETVKSDGYKLVEAGATMFRCTNRSSKDYYVVNSQQPCGLDISHLRTTAYIMKRMALAPFLGDVNNPVNLDTIVSQLSGLKNSIIGMFDNVYSINYSVERASKNCVKIYLDIVYYGIILNEIVYVTEDVV